MKYLFLKDSSLQGSRVLLRGQDYHHVIRVLRHQKGDKLWLRLAGTSDLINSTIEIVGKKQAVLKVWGHTTVCRPSSLSVHLVLAWLKREALASCLQQAVETGVSSISLVATDFSVADKSHFVVKKDRYEKLIQQAGEQCGNPYLPKLTIEQSFVRLLNNRKKDFPFLYAHPQIKFSFEQVSLLNWMRTSQPSDCYVFIGPEGGLSERELACLREIKAFQVSFPTYILRSCTASLYLISLVQSLYEEVSNGESTFG